MRELFRRTKVPVTFKIGNWSEFYEKTQSTRNHFIFTTSRTPERENLFKWVGPLARDVFYLVALENSKINPTSNLRELRKLKVSGITGDQPVQFLQKIGFKVILIDDDKERYARFRAGTLDLDIMSEISQPSYEKLHDLKFKRIYRMYKQDYYIAFNPDTPSEFIDNLNRELRKLRKSDLFKKLHDEYIPTSTALK